MSRPDDRSPAMPPRRPEPPAVAAAPSTRCETALVRHLLAEGSAEERVWIAERLGQEPELARELARLAALWSNLELPPTAPVAAGFTARVVARARAEQSARDEGRFAWAAAPLAVRLAAAGALALGLATGAGLAAWTPGVDAVEDASGVAWQESSLAELYAQAVDVAADDADADSGAAASGSPSEAN